MFPTILGSSMDVGNVSVVRCRNFSLYSPSRDDQNTGKWIQYVNLRFSMTCCLCAGLILLHCGLALFGAIRVAPALPGAVI